METSTWYVVISRGGWLAWIKPHERGTPVRQVCDRYRISRKTFLQGPNGRGYFHNHPGCG